MKAGREAENSKVRLERSIGEVRDLGGPEREFDQAGGEGHARMKNALSNGDATLSKTARDMRDSFGNIDASIKKELATQTVVIKAQEEKLQKELRAVEDSTQDRLVKLGSSVSAADGTQKTKYA